MTNGNDNVSAVQAVNSCYVTTKSSFREVPNSRDFVIAFSCYHHSRSNAGELSHMDGMVDLMLPHRWPPFGIIAYLS